MADASQFYQKRALTLDPVLWTDVIPPIDCRNINVNNSTSGIIYIRTDKTSSTTQDTLAPGAQEALMSTSPTERFAKNVAAFSLLSGGGTPTIVITFLR